MDKMTPYEFLENRRPESPTPMFPRTTTSSAIGTTLNQRQYFKNHLCTFWLPCLYRSTYRHFL